ncbi:MAG TPA: outer membrane beta-barrel protein [Terracidiphilus sp.]
MQMRWMHRVFLLIGAAALASAAACAQTDIAGSVYGAFSGATSGNNTVQSPSNAAGALLEVRHISHPWLGYEGTYSYNRANQNYSYSFVPLSAACPSSGCSFPSGVVSANAHEVTGDYVASLKLANLRPFALAGGGILLDVPSSGQETAVTSPCNNLCNVIGITTTTISTTTSTKPVFVYGAGVDWGLLPHIGLRLQYRGNLYKAPDLTTVFTSTGAFTHTAEPMIGIYFRL